jgi:hypothetical protein
MSTRVLRKKKRRISLTKQKARVIEWATVVLSLLWAADVHSVGKYRFALVSPVEVQRSPASIATYGLKKNSLLTSKADQERARTSRERHSFLSKEQLSPAESVSNGTNLSHSFKDTPLYSPSSMVLFRFGREK